MLMTVFGCAPVVPMPDERTNSNITWYNSPLRGNQQEEGLLDMILVGQWHRYHAPAVINKIKMARREEDSEASDSDSDSESPELNDKDNEELEKVSDTLRAKLARIKPTRKKKNTKKTFRSDAVLVVDIDVKLWAPGLKGLLSDTDDDVGAKESAGKEAEPQGAAAVAPKGW
ncbi:hypothetical protein B0H19DRAFT_1077799 [Mycena capillaripes]|nr:hypothetical protein B0H19DRAFT_1077799 [Mycena capillaripes]